MTKINLTALTILFFMTTHAIGQNKTYFGMEAAMTNDIYEITDNGNNLKSVPLVTGLWGFNLRQDIHNIFLETGLIRKYYDEGFGFHSMDGYGSSNAIDAWIIPLRLGTKINLCKDKIYFVPIIGYSFCINSDYGSYGYGSGSQKSGSDSISYNYSDNVSLTKNFSLLQTGLGFEFKLFKTAILSVSTNYYTGFKKTVQLDINYKTNNSATTTGKAFSKGEFWSFGVGLKYPISDFWTKKKA